MSKIRKIRRILGNERGDGDVDALAGLVIWTIIGLSVIGGIVWGVNSVIKGINWLENTSSNLTEYGTNDEQRIAEIKEEKKAHDIAVAEAPVKADPSYYTHLSERAKISGGTVSNLRYEPNPRDGIYFDVGFTNNDSQPHNIDVVFQISDKYLFNRKISLNPGYNTRKIAEPPEDYTGVSFASQSRFGVTSLSVNARIGSIDGLPAQDPRDVLLKFNIQNKFIQYNHLDSYGKIARIELVVKVEITNTDNLSHIINGGQIDYTRTYTNSDGLKTEQKTLKFDRKQIGGKKSVIQDISLENNTVSILINQIVIELGDLGVEKVPSFAKTRTFTSPDWKYEK